MVSVLIVALAGPAGAAGVDSARPCAAVRCLGAAVRSGGGAIGSRGGGAVCRGNAAVCWGNAAVCWGNARVRPGGAALVDLVVAVVVDAVTELDGARVHGLVLVVTVDAVHVAVSVGVRGDVQGGEADPGARVVAVEHEKRPADGDQAGAAAAFTAVGVVARVLGRGPRLAAVAGVGP